MRIYSGDGEVTTRPRIMALGVFDGVHLGHQEIFSRLNRASNGLTRCAFTFYKNPRFLLCPDGGGEMIYGCAVRAGLIFTLGADEIIFNNFDRDFSEISPEDFFARLLGYGTRAIVIGENFRFGKGAVGNADTLETLCRKAGIDLHVIKSKKLCGEAVSSTKIRQLISSGDVSAAAKLLGRNLVLTGRVIHGKALGRTIGLPTANIVPSEGAVPRNGVYAAFAHLNGNRYPAVVNIGVRPTVNGSEKTTEAHIIDFVGDIYGKRLGVEFICRLRDEKRFDSIDELKKAIESDREKTAQMLARGGANMRLTHSSL